MTDREDQEDPQLITFDVDMNRILSLLIHGKDLDVQEMTIPLKGWECRCLPEFENTPERLNDGFMTVEGIERIRTCDWLSSDDVLKSADVVQECIFINIAQGSFQVNLIDNNQVEWWSEHADIDEAFRFKPGQPAKPSAPLARYSAYVATQVTIRTSLIVQARSGDEAHEKLQAKALEERGNYAKWAHENLPDDHKFEISLYNVTTV